MLKLFKSRPATGFGPAKDRDAEVASHPAVDAFADLLRALGESARVLSGDTSADVARTAEGWARHVLLGEPSPLLPNVREAREFARRDFAGAKEFGLQALRRQSERVRESLGDLREALSAVLRGMNDAVSADSQQDEALHAHLARMRAAVESGDPTNIRREVMSAVEGIGSALNERRERNLRQVAETGRRLRSLHEQLADARRESETDPLTRLANRRAFDAALEESLQFARETGAPSLLLLLDLDHFKRINDEAGHAAGDAVLQRVSNVLARCFLRRGDLVARWGGEELAVLLSETPAKETAALAQRALQAVRELDLSDVRKDLRVTVSVGVAAASVPGDAKEWVERADRALYAAKAAGRDCAFVLSDGAPSRL